MMDETKEEDNSVLPPRTEKEKESSEIGIIRELSPRKVLEDLRMKMKGYEYDYEKDKYIKIKGSRPLMNDEGISKYMMVASAVISDVITFGNYTIEEVPRLALYVCEEIIPVIHINYREYGIAEKSNLAIINVQIFSLTYGALKKAVGAGDRGVIGRSISENILTRSGYNPQMQMQPQKKGFFAGLFGRNK